MRTRAGLMVPLAVALAATPALAHRGADDGHHRAGPAAERPAKGTARPVLHLAIACVTADATGTGVEVRVVRANRHMRRALAGTRETTATIGDGTRIRLVGRARKLPEGSTPRRAPRVGSYADLTAGDRIVIRLRAPRGTAADDLPAARRIVDTGPARRCATAPDPQPAPAA